MKTSKFEPRKTVICFAHPNVPNVTWGSVRKNEHFLIRDGRVFELPERIQNGLPVCLDAFFGVRQIIQNSKTRRNIS